ncbi:MAG: pyridoxamine 5'-phosphate oxidase family protein [Deltaproteobacteria bacterium]|nr:pyridoxamine 5'-phosphate oxidase family protein [Deltaproteobacteria bacterium]
MTTLKKKSKTTARKKIIDFLNSSSSQVDPKPGKHSCGLIHKNALVLATCANNKPRATTLEFFNEGLTVYILGEPGGKIANIKRNPAVSAVVYEQCSGQKRENGTSITLLKSSCPPRLKKKTCQKKKLSNWSIRAWHPLI